MEAVPVDVNLSILFTELPLLDRPKAAAALGFRAAELWWPFSAPTPSGREATDLREALEEVGMRLVCLNFEAGNLAEGDRGLVSLPGQEGRFRESVLAALEFARPLGCRNFNALYGNRLSGSDPQRQDELALENLAHAARAAAAEGGTVLLETQNPLDSPHYPLTSVGQVAELIGRLEGELGVSNVRLLADLYHLHRAGADLAPTLSAVLELVGHVQVADDPGRHQPGSGEVDFAPVLEVLRLGGYPGHLGLEYRPLPTSEESFAWIEEAPWTGAVTMGDGG